jgi:hypothetical protein
MINKNKNKKILSISINWSWQALIVNKMACLGAKSVAIKPADKIPAARDIMMLRLMKALIRTIRGGSRTIHESCIE